VVARIVLTLIALVVLAGCGGDGEQASGEEASGEQRTEVVAAFYPLAFAADRIGGDCVSVRNLTPPGVEPHDLELTPDGVEAIAEADLVVYVGGGFQPAVEDALAGLDSTRQFDALVGEDLLQGENEEGEQAADPHIWLDPLILDSIADETAARLSELDPDRAEMFSENAARLQSELRQLDEEFSTGLAHCRSHEIVTSHAAFGYLAARYDLEQVSISGIDPEAEPTPARLAEVATFVQEHHVTTIFFEELAPPDLAETLARETGARTDVLSPLETPPEQGDYLSEMRLNLKRLESALDCE
jgi:zinc transport system substrate-binding protein